MAGFNMSGDLQRPASNIPTGSLAAIGISWFLYIVFVFLMGAICTRESLRYDFMIAEKVALVGFLFLLGLYISSLASCMGGLYGAPRILQCIAQEKVIPILAFLGHGRGPNKTPVAAICLTSLLTMAFVFVGQVNVLAPIVTINFMLTYSAVDYSYFSASMRYDLHQKQQSRRRGHSRTIGSSQPLISSKSSGYGSDGIVPKSSAGTLLEFTKDMDQLFKPIKKDMSDVKIRGEREKNDETKIKPRNMKKPAKQTLQDSFLLDPNYHFVPAQESTNALVTESDEEQTQCFSEKVDEHKGVLCLAGPADTEQTCDHEIVGNRRQICAKLENSPMQKNEDPDIKQTSQEYEIQNMPTSFYSKFCNHWISFIGAIGSLVIMFVIQWIYALVNIGVAAILYLYIGRVSPGLPPGASAGFSFLKWIQLLVAKSFRREPSPQEQIFVTPSFATVGMETTQLTEENADFASRDRYHHSSFICRGEFVNQFN